MFLTKKHNENKIKGSIHKHDAQERANFLKSRRKSNIGLAVALTTIITAGIIGTLSTNSANGILGGLPNNLFADPDQLGVQCQLSDAQLAQTNRQLVSIGLAPITAPSPEEVAQCEQRVAAQGRIVLNPDEIDFSLGYNDGTIDAQLDRFGATSAITIDDTTINTPYVQGYVQGFYNTYVNIYGIAPW